MPIQEYLETLIKEKGSDKSASINKPGHIGLTWANLIEFIEVNCDEEQKAQIHCILAKIDFNNGDIFDYLNHLANGMIEASGLSQYTE
jgi:hypothetical protein